MYVLSIFTVTNCKLRAPMISRKEYEFLYITFNLLLYYITFSAYAK